jgi:dTDP-D-glucose 4,6-dehydratase
VQDEVFSLGPDGHFRGDSRSQPNPPYPASNAASDHLVRAWRETLLDPISQSEPNPIGDRSGFN